MQYTPYFSKLAKVELLTFLLPVRWGRGHSARCIERNGGYVSDDGADKGDGTQVMERRTEVMRGLWAFVYGLFRLFRVAAVVWSKGYLWVHVCKQHVNNGLISLLIFIFGIYKWSNTTAYGWYSTVMKWHDMIQSLCVQSWRKEVSNPYVISQIHIFWSSPQDTICIDINWWFHEKKGLETINDTTYLCAIKSDTEYTAFVSTVQISY